MRTGNRKKLSLNRETIIDLQADDLGKAAGGKSKHCGSGICSASGVCVCDTKIGCTTGTVDEPA